MSFRTGGIRLVSRVFKQAEASVFDLPLFLCPALLSISHKHPARFSVQRRKLHSSPELLATSSSSTPYTPNQTKKLPAKLPLQCAGCGALSQTVDKEEPGFYNLRRKTVRDYVEGKAVQAGDLGTEEYRIIQKSLENASALDPNLLEQLAFDLPVGERANESVIEDPMCERCHNLKHHDTGVSIRHPSIQALEETVLESPYKYNHIYHAIDAADFPMSLVPGIHKLLNMTQRSLNRRAKSGRYYHGKKTEISFIITRSDLLAPKKEQVDAMMPYLRTVLRSALGRDFNEARLGNIRCVSAKRAWWTKELKDDIWKRGGGGWIVGKVNVGKSQLFQEVFPKGRGNLGSGKLIKTVVLDVPAAEMEENIPDADMEQEEFFTDAKKSFEEDAVTQEAQTAQELLEDSDYLNTFSLLPPAQIETDYPAMPLISGLPGTTASPIRIPFGNGKGELVDLPGLSRGDLELHVQPEHRSSLIMHSRIRPEQKVIKPGQSLLLGGFIRITPTTPDLVFLAYAFNPLDPHLTSTEKAVGIQNGTGQTRVENIALTETAAKIISAGTFHLKWDVTRQRAGPITARDAADIHVDRLPYRVMSADLLIAGCGWVELVAQIRKRPGEMHNPDDKSLDGVDSSWPSFEVFTPEGNFIGIRQPMNAWLNVRFKPGEKNMKGRPRKSMKGHDKNMKAQARSVRHLSLT
ncbi:hypothetical protein BJ878DRAFT_413309 [Calycina marina]|uniref:Uncharacterized protein n=1 Tax=Calycina marina TaxID=1763456 RepID=A0A9P8CIQ3_9HELO|nr:hypothetical protein BJ878DRAFT_413309 [Calycina marina]